MIGPARLLVVDPPWLFGDRLPGPGRGAVKHYPCMPLHEIMRFPLPVLAPDCLLLLWRVSAMQQEALDVVRAWGFTLKSELVWVKTTKRAPEPAQGVSQSLAFGMGRYVRGSHETCLIATRGRFKVASRSERSVFFAPVGKHSAKPDEFYRIAERLGGGPGVELFARRPRPGWLTYGNELEISAPGAVADAG